MTTLNQKAPFAVPAAFRDARVDLPNEIVIIAAWADEEACDINIQDFNRNGEAFIPVFSNEAEFDRQAVGSGFETSGVVIDTDLFLSIMRGGEWLIVDPGGSSPREIRLPAIS